MKYVGKDTGLKWTLIITDNVEPRILSSFGVSTIRIHKCIWLPMSLHAGLCYTIVLRGGRSTLEFLAPEAK